MTVRLSTSVICTLLVLAWAATSAEAAPNTEQLVVKLDGQNNVMSGAGSGWNAGAWVYYPNTGWWNQWFYNDPPDPLRSSYIDYHIMADQVEWDPTGTIIDIVINWSTLAYPVNPLSPPIPPLNPTEESLFIQRSYVVYSGSTNGYNGWSGHLVIPDYNPEWVSIDVRTSGGPLGVETVAVFGSLTHECVGEVATPHPGDANNDGAVNVVDLGVMAKNYDTANGATWAMADFSGDGAVNVVDLGILAKNYDWVGAPAGAVPEPATLSLLALGGLALLRRK